MKLSDRIKQLAEFDIHYHSFPLDESDKGFFGDVVARFDDGEGVEYISLSNILNDKFVEKSIGLYRILVAEIGAERADEETKHGLLMAGRRVEVESHVLLDLSARMMYKFELPSRSYLDLFQTSKHGDK